jgi:hypothetical protein
MGDWSSDTFIMYVYSIHVHSRKIYQPTCPHQSHSTMLHIVPLTMCFGHPKISLPVFTHQSTSQHLQCSSGLDLPHPGPCLSSPSSCWATHSPWRVQSWGQLQE